MQYTTITQLRKEFSEKELAIFTGDPNGIIINEERINYFCKTAGDEVDTYLSIRYDLPLIIVPDLIYNLAYELAVYNIIGSYHSNDEIPDQIKWRRINALNLLRTIKKGEIILVQPEIKSSIITRNIDEPNEFDLKYLKTNYF